jgi:hypothetical protein
MEVFRVDSAGSILAFALVVINGNSMIEDGTMYQGLIPFDKDGIQMEIVPGKPPKTPGTTIANYWRGHRDVRIDWCENKSWKDRLICNGYRYVSSGANIIFNSLNDYTRYVMNLSDFMTVVNDLESGILEGEFAYKKTGSKYSVVKLSDRE